MAQTTEQPPVIPNDVPYGLGRIPHFDERSRNYPLRAVIEAIPMMLPKYKYWHLPRPQLALNQGQTPRCVVYSQQTLLICGPTVNKQMQDLSAWYNWAQQNDYWPGEAYDGTSVLAGAQYGINQGWYSEYRWQFSLDDCVEWVLGYGPLLVGTWWHNSMFRPVRGWLKLDGNKVGGHAYTIVGANQEQRKFKIVNSWGNGWGRRGAAWITFDDMWSLLADDGEGLAVFEKRLAS